VPRPRTGTVRRRKNGMVVVVFEVGGQRFTEPLGRNLSDGEIHVAKKMLMERVNSGDWVPPRASMRPPKREPPVEVPTYRHMAALCLRDWSLLIESDASKNALVWQLNLFMDALGARRIDEIAERDIRRAALDLRAERVAIEQARAEGAGLKQTIITRTGRSYEAQRRGVNNNGINKGIKTVSRVMYEAKMAGYIGEVPSIKPALLPARKVRRSFLHPHQVLAMLDAAKVLEAQHRGLDWAKVRYIRRSDKPAVVLAKELHVSDVLVGKVRRGECWPGEPGPRNRNDIPRRSVLGALVLAGPRVKELCWFDGHHVDLPGRRLRVPAIGTKSVAGVRMVPMLPGLHELLLDHRADRGYGQQDPVFPTRNGTRNSPNNILSHIVVPARLAANTLLAEREQEPIEHLTPHTLRRTFASILALCEVHPRRARQLMGHEDYRTTADVYEQDLDDSDQAVEMLERVLGCDLAEAHDVFAKRRVSVAKPSRDEKRSAGADLGSLVGE
jgi:integrase